MIIQADARHIPLADKSVQCVVTSPPYWGLRDYGTATWVGGDHLRDGTNMIGCDHLAPMPGGFAASGLANYENGLSDKAIADKMTQRQQQYRNVCGKCGATRIDSQIGLEPTPEEYVKKIVAVFAEVWRVLRDDGTCWVNLGDSYAGSAKGMGADGTAYGGPKQRTNSGSMGLPVTKDILGLKPKDLVGIPWRVAFALQAAGWYLRSDIIWSKPNPMPESVTDRPTKSHEYIFLLSKKERYFFDQDAVREDHQANSLDRYKYSLNSSTSGFIKDAREGSSFEKMRNGANMGEFINPAGRNIRTVWEIATQPFPSAHFATFPEEIAVRCIKAGTSEKGACAKCGAPWARVTHTENPPQRSGYRRDIPGQQDNHMPRNKGDITPTTKTLGWQPTCKCARRSALVTPYCLPCVVLDPFSGAGTVPLVADKLNRRGIGLELKSDYCRMAHERCYDDAPLFAAL